MDLGGFDPIAGYRNACWVLVLLDGQVATLTGSEQIAVSKQDIRGAMIKCLDHLAFIKREVLRFALFPNVLTNGIRAKTRFKRGGRDRGFSRLELDAPLSHAGGLGARS